MRNTLSNIITKTQYWRDSGYVLQINPDATQKVKFVTQYTDGNLSNIKISTLFPEGWSSDKIINGIKTVGDSSPMGVRASDGVMLYRDMIDSVQIEAIKIGDTVTSVIQQEA